MGILNFFLVFLGGGLGSMLRYGIGQWIPNKAHADVSFPWATLLANVLATALLGLGLAYFGKSLLSAQQRLLLLTGFCGGFSTFSTFSAELWQLWSAGHPYTAGLYLLLSIVASLAAFLLSYHLGGGNMAS